MISKKGEIQADWWGSLRGFLFQFWGYFCLFLTDVFLQMSVLGKEVQGGKEYEYLLYTWYWKTLKHLLKIVYHLIQFSYRAETGHKNATLLCEHSIKIWKTQPGKDWNFALVSA